MFIIGQIIGIVIIVRYKLGERMLRNRLWEEIQLLELKKPYGWCIKFLCASPLICWFYWVTTPSLVEDASSSGFMAVVTLIEVAGMIGTAVLLCISVYYTVQYFRIRPEINRQRRELIPLRKKMLRYANFLYSTTLPPSAMYNPQKHIINFLMSSPDGRAAAMLKEASLNSSSGSSFINDYNIRQLKERGLITQEEIDDITERWIKHIADGNTGGIFSFDHLLIQLDEIAIDWGTIWKRTKDPSEYKKSLHDIFERSEETVLGRYRARQERELKQQQAMELVNIEKMEKLRREKREQLQLAGVEYKNCWASF